MLNAKLIVLFGFMMTSVGAESIKNKVYDDIHVLEITSIYDGDTFRANLKNMPSVIGERMSIRVSGIDVNNIR